MPPVNRNQPKRAASSESQYSLMEFMREFPDDATCLEWLWRNRYSEDGEHAFCPACTEVRTFKRYSTKQARQSWSCTHCADKIHPTAGTIFHKSSTSLHLWFYAMYLMTSTRCGISAKQVERELGVTYKTAWRMCNLIRGELMQQDDGGKLEGIVEADETYIGGRVKRNGWKDRYKNKSVVFGMVERKGRVLAAHVANNKRATILPILRSRILPESIVYTDEAPQYNKGLERYSHDRVKHSERVYVSGDVHTNTIEGFWALTKNGLQGVYHSVSSKHLQGYLNEYAWRYNHRDDGRAMFRTLLLRTLGD